MDRAEQERVCAAIRALTRRRYPGSVCPSEVAHELSPGNWRPLMPVVRGVAATLAEAGELRVTQRGEPVDAERAKGPIRLSAVGGG